MINKSTCFSVLKGVVTAAAASMLLSACVGYVAPGPWVPGHYGPRGGWIPGHYAPAPVVVGPVVAGKYVPPHVNKWGWWKPGHWKA